MQCIYCGGETLVADSRPHKTTVRRRRRCTQCARIFLTDEMAAQAAPIQTDKLERHLKAMKLRMAQLETELQLALKLVTG